MRFVMTPEAEVQEVKRREAAKYQPNWAHRVSQWLLRTWVLASSVVAIGLVNYFWYKNDLTSTTLNSIMLTSLIVYLPLGIAKGPAVWTISTDMKLHFAPGVFSDMGPYGTFDWETETLRRTTGSQDLATVVWLIEHTPTGDVRRGILMWSPKPSVAAKKSAAHGKAQHA